MRKQAFLIVAHHRPSQLMALVSKLIEMNIESKDIENYIYIHIDKSTKGMYDIIADAFKGQDNVKIISEYECSWGGYGIVKSYLKLIELALTDECNYYHLLSGDCYPVASNDVIYSESNEYKKSFIKILDLDISPSYLIDRMKYYNLANVVNVRHWQGYRLNEIFVKIQKLFHIEVPEHLYEDIHYNTSLLASFNYKIAEDIYEVHVYEKKYNKLFKTCLIPDEIFMGVPEVINSYNWNNIINDNKRVQKWVDGMAQYLEPEDVSEENLKDKWFVRKVDFRNEKVRDILTSRVL